VASSEPADDAVPPYASFGARAGAAFVDAAIAIGATVPAVLVLLFGPSHDTACSVDGATTTCTQPSPATLTFSAALLGAALVGYTLWWARLAGSGQTVGPRIGAVRIVDLGTGQPIGTARERFSVKYYLVAMLFILFDIEAIFLFPWAVVYRELKMFAFVEMLLFIVLVLAGFFYIWKKGVLNWAMEDAPTDPPADRTAPAASAYSLVDKRLK